MFKFAESGIVAWPTKFPVDQDGLPTPTKVLVRYRVLTRAELKELDRDNAVREASKLAEKLAELAMPAPSGQSVQDGIAAAEQRARAVMALVDEGLAKSEARERARTERLLARVVSIQPPGETEFAEFAPGELARHLEFEVLAKAYEAALLDASKAAVAKN